MACFKPLRAWKKGDGSLVFRAEDGAGESSIPIACGRCIGCRLDKSREWASRCIHEAQMHEQNSYVTLSYDDEHLPDDWSVDKREWQLFAKRLRKAGKKFRYLECGEYGGKKLRPHYHALLFGVDFREDRKFLKMYRGNPLYVSPTLEKAWDRGFCTIGAVTWQSAAYVARYVMKAQNGPRAEERLRRVELSPEGEVLREWKVKPPFATMSRDGGLGKKWFEKFKTDVYPSGYVVHNGQKFRPPSFYTNLLPLEEKEKAQENRRQYIEDNMQMTEYEQTKDRVTREKFTVARLSKLRRPEF